MSSVAPAGANRCAQCFQVAACPWLEPPAGPRRRTEEEALHQRIEDAQKPSHGDAGTASAALLWIRLHLRDPTSVVHLLHLLHPDPRPTPRLAEPSAPCYAEEGTGRSTPEPSASGARWRTW